MKVSELEAILASIEDKDTTVVFKDPTKHIGLWSVTRVSKGSATKDVPLWSKYDAFTDDAGTVQVLVLE